MWHWGDLGSRNLSTVLFICKPLFIIVKYGTGSKTSLPLAVYACVSSISLSYGSNYICCWTLDETKVITLNAIMKCIECQSTMVCFSKASEKIFFRVCLINFLNKFNQIFCLRETLRMFFFCRLHLCKDLSHLRMLFFESTCAGSKKQIGPLFFTKWVEHFYVMKNNDSTKYIAW